MTLAEAPDPERLHAGRQRGRSESKHPRSARFARDLPGAPFQCWKYVRVVQLPKLAGGSRDRGFGQTSVTADLGFESIDGSVRWKDSVEIQCWCVAQDDSAFNDVLQLADISGPIVGTELAKAIRRQLDGLTS